MAKFCVISAIGRSDLNFPVGLTNKSRECLCVSHINQGQVSVNNLMRTGVHWQMQFPPDAALFLTMLFRLPLPFTEHFNPVESITRWAISPRMGFLNGMLTDLARLLTQV